MARKGAKENSPFAPLRLCVRQARTALHLRAGFLFCLLLLTACTPALPAPQGATQPAPALPPGFDVQGHRGARGLQPENTLPAFETALDLGVTTLELDLHLTADGEVVIWHDPTITPDKCSLPDATAADAAPPQPASRPRIADLTFAALQHYRCDRNPDAGRFPAQEPAPTLLAGDDYRIVRLADLFDFVARYAASDRKRADQRTAAGQVHFNIETKRKPDDPAAIGDDFDGVNPGRFEREIARIVAEFGLTDRAVLQSFDHRSLWAMRRLQPELQLAALTTRSVDLADLAQRGAAIWSPDFATLTPALLAEAHALGLAVIPWTVNDPADMHRLIEMGVDGLITDRPDLLLGNLP